MSKFWANAASSSESESGSDRDSEDDVKNNNKGKIGGRYDLYDESSGKDILH